MEAYSRRENLIITGIPESREDTGVEDTAKVLVDFMANELNVSNGTDIDFQRVHRLGKPKDKGPRAIIARFLKYPDKVHVLKSIIDKLDHLVLWIYLYVACQQGSAPLLSEEPNSGTP